jgi:hypothetical protein
MKLGGSLGHVPQNLDIFRIFSPFLRAQIYSVNFTLENEPKIRNI